VTTDGRRGVAQPVGDQGFDVAGDVQWLHSRKLYV